MKIQKIQIRNFRGIEKEALTFNDFDILIGDNGTSKTTILEAINYCLSPNFASNRVKYSDFFQGKDEPIEITVIFDEGFNADLLDGYNSQTISCKGVFLSIKKRDSIKGINKALTDGFVIKHFLIPAIERPDRCKFEWIVKRKNMSKFVFTDRHLTEALPQMPYRTFYFDKNRERQLQRGFSSSITSVYDDFNWRFVKNVRSNSANPFVEEINKLEQIIIGSVDENAIGKTLNKLNDKLRVIIGEEIGVSFIDRFEPFNNANLCKKVGDVNLAVAQLGSGIDMIVSIMFLDTLADLAKDEYTILIDEPEMHLHPSLQIKLVKYLSELAKKHQVIISTHSPFVFKNLSHGEANLIPRGGERVEQLFPWSPSWGEINYFTYGIATIEFHNELYGRLQAIAVDEDTKYENEHDFDQWLKSQGVDLTKQWIRIKQRSSKQPYPCTLQTYIRNTIHHPENRCNEKYTESELKDSIDEMIILLKKISHEDSSTQN